MLRRLSPEAPVFQHLQAVRQCRTVVLIIVAVAVAVVRTRRSVEIHSFFQLRGRLLGLRLGLAPVGGAREGANPIGDPCREQTNSIHDVDRKS